MQFSLSLLFIVSETINKPGRASWTHLKANIASVSAAKLSTNRRPARVIGKRSGSQSDDAICRYWLEVVIVPRSRPITGQSCCQGCKKIFQNWRKNIWQDEKYFPYWQYWVFRVYGCYVMMNTEMLHVRPM